MLRLGRYERLLVENRRFRSNGGRLTQNFRYKGSHPTNHSSSQKTRLNVLSYGLKIWTNLSSILPGITRVTDGRTDGWTDGRTEFSSLYRVCITCSAVKTSRVTLCTFSHIGEAKGDNHIVTKFCIGVGIPDVITYANFSDCRFRDFFGEQGSDFPLFH